MQTAFYSSVDREYQRISYRSVLYIVAQGNYSIVVTTKGQKICIYATLSCLEAKLPKNFFTRVHRSYIISLKRVSKFNKHCATIGGEQIPLNQEAFKILEERLNVICNDFSLKKIKAGKIIEEMVS